MRLNKDAPDKLTKVRWFFVERTDFIQNNAFVSSVYDELPDFDGCGLGEDASTRVHCSGNLPPLANIQKTPLGTDAQWANGVQDYSEGSEMELQSCVRLGAAAASWLTCGCTPGLGLVYQGDLTAPGVTKTNPIRMQAAPIVANGIAYTDSTVVFGMSGYTNYYWVQVPQSWIDYIITGWPTDALIFWYYDNSRLYAQGDGVIMGVLIFYQGVWYVCNGTEGIPKNLVYYCAGEPVMALRFNQCYYDFYFYLNINPSLGATNQIFLQYTLVANSNVGPNCFGTTPGSNPPGLPCPTKPQAKGAPRPPWFPVGTVTVDDPDYEQVTLTLCELPLTCYKSDPLPDGSSWMWLGSCVWKSSQSPLSGMLFFARTWEAWRALDFVSMNSNESTSNWEGVNGHGRILGATVTVTAMLPPNGI